MSVVPNFFIIGAQKAGTTYLYYLLKQHPEIFLPVIKEPGFFHWVRHAQGVRWPDGKVDKVGVSDWAEYLRLYADHGDAKALGDASTIYLYDPESATAIRDVAPDAKIVAVIRDPVLRAYSAYNYMRRNGKEPVETFDAALALEPERIAEGVAPHFHYVNRGFYGQQLTAWYEAFPSAQIKVILFDDLVANPVAECAELFAFLGVDSGFAARMETDEGVRKNVSGIPRTGINAKVRSWIWGPTPVSAFLKKLFPVSVRSWMRLRAMDLIGSKGLLTPEPLSAVGRVRLRERFLEDIGKLEILLGKQLPGWNGRQGDAAKSKGIS